MSRVWRLLGSAPVRLALALVLVFSLVSLGTLGGAYLVLRGTLEAQMSTALSQRVAGYRAAPSAGALGQLVEAEARTADARDRVLSFVASDGRVFGNVRAETDGETIRFAPLRPGDALAPPGYVSLAVPMQGGLLVLATSRAPLDDLTGVFLNLLWLSVLPTAALALGLALWLARGQARRVTRIETVLARITAGDLSARIAAVGDAQDDLLRIAAGIDRMAAAQEASTSALRQISADIAHDLKTPLQRITLNLHRLTDTLADNPKALALAEQVLAEADRTVQVFQSLLTIAQIEGGRGAALAPVDLAALAATIVEIFGPDAEDSGHALALDRPAHPVMVQGDAMLLGQVLTNLVENALRHTPPGGTITVTVAEAPVRLGVADQGPGIPEDERAHVLRRLYRLERSRTTPGNGLGLSLASAIADLHGAPLRLQDNAPGLRVEMTFPPA